MVDCEYTIVVDDGVLDVHHRLHHRSLTRPSPLSHRMTTTFEEEKVKKGICSEVDYPYTQSQGTCSYDMCTPVEGSIVKDQIDIVPRKTNALKEALKKQPVTAAMVASDPMFQFYSSGIYTVKDCGKVTKQFGEEDCQKLYQGQDTCLPDINHGVLVVGYGTDQTATTDVKGYFKVKNSWGEAWGESGYFRLARYEEDPTDPMTNWGECAILTLLSAPVMG
jgi:C1A family cysteine protease